MQQEQSNQFKVAPVISDEKQKELFQQIIRTLLGAPTQLTSSAVTIIWAIILPLITFLIPLLVSSIYIAIIVPFAINIVLNIIVEISWKRSEVQLGQLFIRNIILAAYTVLWSHHVFVLSQYHMSQSYQFFFSALSILTSIWTVAFASVKEFGAHSVDNSFLAFESTAFMRAFIAFPTLFAEICIYNAPNNNPTSNSLYPLRVVSSFVFLAWWMGWFSSIKNTLYFVLNRIVTIIFGEESQYNWLNAFKCIITNMIPFAIYEIIYYRNEEYSLNPLIVGPTMTSIVTFIKNNLVHNEVNKSEKSRSYLMILVESLICIMLVLLHNLGKLSNVSLSIFLAIDIGIYFGFNILKQFGKGWSRFGLNIHCKLIKYNYLLLINRILLRVFSGLCILLIMTNYLFNVLTQFNYQVNIISYIIIPILGYRSFKRCVSETTSFSLHLSLLICLIAINTGYVSAGCLVVLMMPPFPPNSYQTLVSVFQIPPKAQHKNECVYQILYFFGTLIGLCLHFLSLGSFELTMFFGLPLYLPCFPTQTQGYQVKSAQNSLYEKIIQSIDASLFRFYDAGFYLLRIEKYILLLEIKSTCYGFCQLVVFRGLEVQQVTSCHSKEGESIDKMVEQTWGDNKQTCTISPYQYAITPFLNEKIFVPTENDIQLTGVIQSKEFVQLFKQTALKSIIRQYSKLTLTENQKKQAEVMMGEISAFYKKDAAQALFPFDFSKEYNIKATYPSGKVKLPPLNKKGTKKNEVLNDFLDLIDNSHVQPEPSLITLNEKDKESQSQSKKQLKAEEINMTVILTLYYYSIGKLDYIMVEKLYKIIKKENDTISQIEFQNFEKTLSVALGTAFKISIDKYINGQFEVTSEDFTEYDKSSFLGTSDSQEFKNAILNDKEDIWTINFSKRALSIKRMARSETNMYIFKANEIILKSVWNNLRFELIYATNDNDQRYSIQTHPHLMRNLWVEACEQPFGYPSYHSCIMMNK